MQHNNHSSDNEQFILSSLLADDNAFPSLSPDILEPLIEDTIKNLLSPSPDKQSPDNPSPTAQPEELFKARSRKRHSQEFSDISNAHRFVSQHRDRLRYIPQSDRWMLWNGQRWSPDTHNNVDTFARATIQSFRDEALVLPYEQRQYSDQLFNHADRSDTPKRLHAMLDLASQDPALIASPHTFDSDPLLLNVLNGTINLRTAQLQPHNPHDFITHLAPVTYDPAASSPVWDKFLSEITNHDPDLQRYLQSAVGYSLTGSIQERVIFLIQGKGCNGKSTFLNALGSLLGDYAQYTTCDLITSKSTSTSHTPIPSTLLQTRFVIIPDTAADRTLNTLSVQNITGGEITSTNSTTHLAHLSSPRYPQLSFKLWMATNQLPTVRNHSDGTWRRIKLIHFPVSFLGREDKHLDAELLISAPAILNWTIQGCLAWLREGLREPSSVQLTTSGYQDEQDQLAGFLHQCCQFGPQHLVKASELYQDYQAWCQVIGENKPLDAKAFGLQILAHGYLRVHKKAGNFYLGLSPIPLLALHPSPKETSSKFQYPLPPTAIPENGEGW